MSTPQRAAEFGTATHLVRRFVRSLGPGGPSTADELWVAAWLLEPERELWRRMSGPDRRHAVAVARQVSLAAPPGGTGLRPVIAAALLHDVGKVESGLGTGGRVMATMAAMVVGRDRLSKGSGRVGRYFRHDAIGAALLEASGSDRLTISWAREHHLAPGRWTVPRSVGAALKAADDD